MHKKLGTSYANLKPLTEAAKAVRHGNLSSQKLNNAIQNKDKLIKSAVEVMRKEFKRAFPGLI